MKIITYPNYRIFKWFPLSHIYNEEGFQFIGQRKDGMQVVCEVIVRDGLHYISPGVISDYTGWRHLTEEDKDALGICLKN